MKRARSALRALERLLRCVLQSQFSGVLVLTRSGIGSLAMAFSSPALGRLNTAQPRYRQNSEEPEIPKVIEHTVERAAFKKSVNHFSCGCALFSCLSEVCEIANQGIVVADNAGRIRFATEKAVRWLREYFGEPHSPALPDQVKDWLQERSLKLFNYERLAGGVREISIQRGPKRLTIQSVSPLPAKEHRLVLTESTDALDPTPLESLGLTKREAEVLFWAGQAKRNAEIGNCLKR